MMTDKVNGRKNKHAEVHIFDRTKIKVEIGRLSRDTEAIISRLKIKAAFTLNLVLIDNKAIRALKKRYHKTNINTDVIAFPYKNSGREDIEGDVFVSAEQVKAQASYFGNSFYKELIYVVIHGILHILGYADTAAAERTKMFKKQDFIFKSILAGKKC